MPPPPAEAPEVERGTNGTSHDVVGRAMADMSLDGRCLSLPDRLNRPTLPGAASNYLRDVYGCRYYSSSKYSSNFLLLEYALISISGCKLPNCSFNNSENAPIHMLFSNLECGLALDRRASL